MKDSDSLIQKSDGVSTETTALAEGTISAVVAAISVALPQVGTWLTLGLVSAQKREAQQFSHFVEKSFKNIEESKIDKEYLQSPKYLEILLAATQEAEKTISEQNLRALANALANFSLVDKSCKPGKRAIFRTIGQMSSDEIAALTVIAQESEKPQPENGVGFLGVHNDTIANNLNWNVEDTQVVCDSLAQLNLVLDGMHDRLEASSIERKYWKLTPLGKRVISFAVDPTS